MRAFVCLSVVKAILCRWIEKREHGAWRGVRRVSKQKSLRSAFVEEFFANISNPGFSCELSKQKVKAPRCGDAMEMPDIVQHVRACGDCPVFLAMRHMRWLSGQRGHESTDHTQGAVLHIDGLRAWHIDRCSNKDAGRSESQTPKPCEQTTGQDKTREAHTHRKTTHVSKIHTPKDMTNTRT